MRLRRNKRTRKRRGGKWVIKSRITTKRKKKKFKEQKKSKNLLSFDIGNFSFPGLYTKKIYKKYNEKMHNALQIPDRWIIKGKSRTKKLFRWKKKKAKKKKKKEKKLDDMTSKEMKKVGIRRRDRRKIKKSVKKNKKKTK